MGATSCPECGSDESTGWSQSAHFADLGVPDPDVEFDYEEFVENEFGSGGKKRAQPHWLWVAVALVIIAVMLGFVF